MRILLDDLSDKESLIIEKKSLADWDKSLRRTLRWYFIILAANIFSFLVLAVLFDGWSKDFPVGEEFMAQIWIGLIWLSTLGILFINLIHILLALMSVITYKSASIHKIYFAATCMNFVIFFTSISLPIIFLLSLLSWYFAPVLYYMETKKRLSRLLN